jgi:UDP-N-acetyl-D-mannosaminuronic acid transferase (WecB/TagA/CpsF family)
MERVSIDKVLLDPVTMNEAVYRVSMMLEEPRERAAHVVTMNAQFVEIAHQEDRFADLLRRADLSVADGLDRLLSRRQPRCGLLRSKPLKWGIPSAFNCWCGLPA